MENGKINGGVDKPTNTNISSTEPEEVNPNSTTEDEVVVVPNRQSSRTPFTNLSQIDADLALARTLQEQERAYMMLRMNNEGGDYGSWEAGNYFHEEDFDDPSGGTDLDGDEDEYDGTDVDDYDDEGDDDEDAFDVHAHGDVGEVSVENDPSAFPDDEAYARALQDAEEREMAARLLALTRINDVTEDVEDTEDDDTNSQDTWEEVDPDELSYEELLALGDVVGTESRGLSAASIASLPAVNYKAQNNQDGSNESCVICRLDFEDGDTLTVLSCKHSYHPECINNWLQINKVCPVCSAEVSTSENR